jgi:hypothetical protein
MFTFGWALSLHCFENIAPNSAAANTEIPNTNNGLIFDVLEFPY